MVFVCPEVYVVHDEKNENLLIDVMLPGAKKESIKLEFSKNGFCVEAKAEERGTVYFSCYTLAHEVFPDRAKAKYKDGILKTIVPFKRETVNEIDIE